MGFGRHQLDGHWERSKTALDSELLSEAAEVIEDALSHADQRLTRQALTAQEWDLFAIGMPLDEIEAKRSQTVNDAYDLAGLTEAQREVISMRLENVSFRRIGEMLGIHHSSAQERYRSGMAKLRSTPPLLCRTEIEAPAEVHGGQS